MQLDTIINYNEEEQAAMSKAMQQITGQTLLEWIDDTVKQVIYHPDRPINNPFVIDYKTSRPIVKQLENRDITNFMHSTIRLQLDFPVIQVNETLKDHYNGFWTIDRIVDYLLSQLVCGSEKQFKIPFTIYEKFLITTLNTQLIKEDNNDNN